MDVCELKRSHAAMAFEYPEPRVGLDSEPTHPVLHLLGACNDNWRLPDLAQSRVDVATAEEDCHVQLPATCLDLFLSMPYRTAMRILNASSATNMVLIGASGCVGSEIKVWACCHCSSCTSTLLKLARCHTPLYASNLVKGWCSC